MILKHTECVTFWYSKAENKYIFNFIFSIFLIELQSLQNIFWPDFLAVLITTINAVLFSAQTNSFSSPSFAVYLIKAFYPHKDL